MAEKEIKAKNINATSSDQTEKDVMEQLKEKVNEIKKQHKLFQKEKKNADCASMEIGKQLLFIEQKRLYAYAKNKSGKNCHSMKDFINETFDFTYQYAIMLKQSAKVCEFLKCEDVSFRLLRPLNCYSNNEDALREIWGNAIKTANSKIPNSQQIITAIKAYKKEKNNEHDMNFDIMNFLNRNDLTLSKIGMFLMRQYDHQAMNEDVENYLLTKIKDLMHRTSETYIEE